MNVVCVNYTFNPRFTNPDAILDRYQSLVSLAVALKSSGAKVSVVQRFGSDREMTRNGVPVRFVFDPTWKNGSVFDRPVRLNAAVAATHPDVVYVHGLQFARQAWQLKRRLRSRTGTCIPLLLQDHANAPPRHWLNRWTLGRALRRMDAVSFVSRAQAQPWFDAGLLAAGQPVVELMEGSSHFRLKPQGQSRARTGLAGDPLCLWVGRLDTNKDPLTVLRGFAQALPSLPNARLAMIYNSKDLLPAIERWLSENPVASSQVQLLGQRPHRELEDIYNSADIFLLGSHHEGSGYAVLEALACGVMPIVSGIPSFRVLTGEGKVGGLWPPGDTDALTQVLLRRYSVLKPETRQEIRTFFETHFHWDAIGRQAINAYRNLLSANALAQESPNRSDL